MSEQSNAFIAQWGETALALPTEGHPLVQYLKSTLEAVGKARAELFVKLQEAQEAIGLSPTHFFVGWERTRYKNLATKLLARIGKLDNVEEAIKSLYLPLPIMPSVALEDARATLAPVSVLRLLEEADDTSLFDEIRIVTGQDPTRLWAKQRANPDPIIIGIITVPAAGGQRAETWHFFIGAWR